MRLKASKKISSVAVRRLPYFGAIAVLCLAPCAFSQHRVVAHPSGNATADVTVILDDFKGAAAQMQPSLSDGLISSPGGGNSPSGSVARLMHFASEDARQPGDRKKVKMPEPNAAFTWVMDLGGLAAFVFCIRRRPSKVNV
jgi:hypothetical protein